MAEQARLRDRGHEKLHRLQKDSYSKCLSIFTRCLSFTKKLSN
ncbi:MAG: hypothetical protein WBA93_23865 [Microcoleaceae cyanobacterium]